MYKNAAVEQMLRFILNFLERLKAVTNNPLSHSLPSYTTSLSSSFKHIVTLRKQHLDWPHKKVIEQTFHVLQRLTLTLTACIYGCGHCYIQPTIKPSPTSLMVKSQITIISSGKAIYMSKERAVTCLLSLKCVLVPKYAID